MKILRYETLTFSDDTFSYVNIVFHAWLAPKLAKSAYKHKHNELKLMLSVYIRNKMVPTSTPNHQPPPPLQY